MAGSDGELKVLSGFWTRDEGQGVAWPAALACAALVHGAAFSAGVNAPRRVQRPPVEVAIVSPPPRAAEPPPPVTEESEPPPLPRREKRPRSLPPPNETPVPTTTPPQELQPVTGVTADSVVATNASAPQVRVGNTTFGDPAQEQVTPPQEVQRAVAPSFDLHAYRRTVFETMNREKLYPRKARVMGLEGTCRVILLINRDGTLAEAPRLFASTGHEVLDGECLRMARASRFPPVVGDVAVPVRINQPIVFSLISP